jgi:anti-anti-sigma factor
MTATEEMIEVERLADTFVLTPRRNLRELEFEEIRAELLRVANDPGARNVLVDFGHTDYFGSTAVGMLALLCLRVHARGGQMALCNLSAHEREILAITGMAGLCPVFALRQEAFRALAG